MRTESRDGKQEAAAAFVVAEECGNVEALCQTFLKWGQVTFSQRGKATTTTKKWRRGWGLAPPLASGGCRPAGVGQRPPPGAWAGWGRRGRAGAEAAAPATCVALDLVRTPGRGLGVPSAAFQELPQGNPESPPWLRSATPASRAGPAMCCLIPGIRASGGGGVRGR